MTPYARRVLDQVDAIPPGRVLTYGDVADLLGSGAARAVGMVLARYGHEVPWHRVVLATGAPAPGHEVAALRLLRAEGVQLCGERVDLAAARWDGGRLFCGTGRLLRLDRRGVADRRPPGQRPVGFAGGREPSGDRRGAGGRQSICRYAFPD